MSKHTLERIIKARAVMITVPGLAFWGVLALNLKIEEDRTGKFETMATDGTRLIYCAAYVDGLTDPELLFLLAHEVEHPARGHHWRMGNRRLLDWNIAADYAINPSLIAAKVGKMPEGMLFDPAYIGLSAEEIYSIRDKASKQGQKPGQGQPGQGNGAGQGQPGASGAPNGQPGQSSANGQPQPGNGPSGAPAPQGAPMGQGQGQGQGNGASAGQIAAPSEANPHGAGGIMAPDELTPANTQQEADRWQLLTRQAVNIAKAQHGGHVPDYLRETVASLTAPSVDFRQLLADWIDSRVASDTSWSRPNRRRLHTGFIMPGQVNDGFEHVVFVVDTSGSFTEDMLKPALAEISGAMESGKFRRLTVLHADTMVRHVLEYGPGDEIETGVHGGGGTDFRDSFRWIDENAPDASAVIYLTDLEVGADRFGLEPACPVLWATYGDSRQFEALSAPVPFGQALYVGRL